MSAGAVLRGAVVVFVAAMLQKQQDRAVVFTKGAPDVLLVAVVALGLARGSVPGAVFGFMGGVVVDLATLDTLGITSLVLTLAGFWAGRYGETTGRDRRIAPLVAVGGITLLAGLFGYVLHFMLGEEVVARHALVTALLPAFVLNLLIALPINALVRSAVGERARTEHSPEVEVMV